MFNGKPENENKYKCGQMLHTEPADGGVGRRKVNEGRKQRKRRRESSIQSEK